MSDIWFYGCCLRVFWRWRYPWRPYAHHAYGLYAFGIGPIGFMFWPPSGIAAEGR